ncbi:acyltransferase [Ravibacter arvi]|uniref:Acyltransferase n=1 Tax=Ravibacter arvi TaxID=2051041 RepID=A0ABP8MDB5_9BACT
MSQKRFFPNLNGVRFIAAFMVLIHHIEQAKHALDMPNIYHWATIQHMGRLGVGLFFVLSGFLITYLLLQEKSRHGQIAAGSFYLRRAFRIWPIYFIVILSSYFIFPRVPLLEYPGAVENVTNHYWERLSFLLLILPNFAFVLYDLPYWCAQAWSIGVEEQFYYLWPWLFKYPKRKWVIVLFFFAVTALVLWAGLYFLEIPPEKKVEKLVTFLGQFRLQVMAFGGLLAWVVFHNKTKITNFLFRRDVQYAVYAFTIAFYLSGVHFFGFMELYALLFGFFIINVSCNPATVIHLEHKWVSYLGRISYGLYLYHVIAVVATINLLASFEIKSVLLHNILIYSLSIAGTILICVLSYEYLEKPLLAYKDKKFGR